MQTGGRCWVGPRCQINAEHGPVTIGAGARVERNAELLGPVTIGAGTHLNRDAYVRRNVTIGDRVNIGPFVRLITDTHEFGGPERRAGAAYSGAITVGDGCWIGASVTVLGDVTIGAGSIVAAGSVVTADVPPNSLVAGVPARLVRQLDTGTTGPQIPGR